MLPSNWAGALDSLSHRMDTQDAAVMEAIMPRRNAGAVVNIAHIQKVDELARGFGPALLFEMLKLLSDRAK
jgi:hypothetical protein